MAIKNNTKAMDIKRIIGAAPAMYSQDAIHAARMDAVVCGWLNNQVNLNALTVINNIDLYYNLVPGTRVVVLMICAGLSTNSDNVIFQLGYTNQQNASGGFTPAMPYKRYATGAAASGKLDYELIPPIPIVIRYSSGARCITMRVQANDAAASVDLAWQGLVEVDK